MDTILAVTGLEKEAIHLAGIVAVCGFLFLTYRHWSDAIGVAPRSDVYKISTLPFIGSFATALSRGARQVEWFTEVRKERDARGLGHLPLSLSLPGLRMIDLTEPASIEWIQKTNASNYVKGPLFTDNMHDILGDGIFAVDGEKWRVARKATSKVFTGSMFRTVISHSITTDLAKVVKILHHAADTGRTVDLTELFFAYTLSAFSRMAFSIDLNTLTDTGVNNVPFANAFDRAQMRLAKRFNNPFWSLIERFSAGGREMKEDIEILDKFSFGIIDEREKDGLAHLSKEESGRQDLLSLYMALRDENGKPLDRRSLRDAVLNLIIAGRDTTAQALSWTFFHLITNPSLVTPLRAELKTDDLKNGVDYDSYKLMTKHTAVFHETLRLHPSVPKNAHMCLGDDAIPFNGSTVQVRKGEVVRWSDWEMGRMESVWGPDAGVYSPERWIDEKKELIKESQYKFHAFNGGQRLCLGQALATYESVAALAAIVAEFDLTFAPEFHANTEFVDVGDAVKTPLYEDSLTLPMKSPLFVKVARRKVA